MEHSLVSKYNIPGPRYTSYPTVPYWNNETFSLKLWKESLITSFNESNDNEGISLYIHLPFCESLCTFCGCHKRITKRHDVEIPYIDAVIKEWELYCDILPSKPKLKELHIGGGTPTFFAPNHINLLVNSILRKVILADDHEFSFEGHPNNTTYEHLKTFYDLGFRRVSFGVQDYNDDIQKTINRIQPFENVKYVTEMAKAIGFTSVGHDIIFGLPFQTVHHVQATIEKTKTLQPDRIAFYSYAHVPWIKGNGQRGFRDIDLPTAESKRNQYETGKLMLVDAGYHDIGMDHFALQTDSLYKALVSGSLHRNFMGYTASKTKLMIGLGVSSISDSWYGFSQNVKGIEEYYHLLSEHIIPVFKGHILNSEDLIVRKHILNLMCQFKTSWDNNDLYFDELPEVLLQLSSLQDDGLIEITQNSLQVTDVGKPFVRNVCMAFDVLLKRNKPERPLFSMTI